MYTVTIRVFIIALNIVLTDIFVRLSRKLLLVVMIKIKRYKDFILEY